MRVKGGAALTCMTKTKKVSFDDIYGDDLEKCLLTVKTIVAMWDLENGKNEMRVNNHH